MHYTQYVDIGTILLEWVVQTCWMYQILTRTGVVSWDCVCLNTVARLLLLATRSVDRLPWWYVGGHWMCSVWPTIAVLLLLKYPSRIAYYLPYYLRWPVLLGGSAMLSWTAAEFSHISPWFFFSVYTDFFSSIPQGYIIVRMGGKTDNLTVGMFFLLLLNRTTRGLLVAVLGAKWLEPQLMAYWTYILSMCIPLVRFYVDRGRMPQCIHDIV